eukprot:276825_1
MSSRFSNKQWLKMEYLVYGYINNIDDYDETYPAELYFIIMRFYDKRKWLKFDICKSKYKKCLTSYGTVIERGEYNVKYQQIRESKILFGSSVGFNKGSHEWKIKIKQATNALIGVVSDDTDCITGYQ